MHQSHGQYFTVSPSFDSKGQTAWCDCGYRCHLIKIMVTDRTCRHSDWLICLELEDRLGGADLFINAPMSVMLEHIDYVLPLCMGSDSIRV